MRTVHCDDCREPLSLWERLDDIYLLDHPSGVQGILAATYPAQESVTIRAYGSYYTPILYTGTLKGAVEAGWPLPTE